MSEPSPGYLLKLDRGATHRDSLDKAVKGWLKRDHCRAVLEIDPQTGEHVLRAQIAEQPPVELSLLVGDCVHNTRAALDHIAYQLASNFTKTLSDSEAKSVGFPIAREPVNFNPGAIRHVDPSAQSLIKSMQPYNGGDWELLALLHDLDRIDKHRELNLSVACTEEISFNCGIGGDPHSFSFNPPGPVEDEADLIRFRCRPKIGSKGQMEPEASATFQVALSEGPRAWSVIDQLREIDGLIRNKVIPLLVPFL